jgi:CheY-like chemotaxis protein
MRHGIGKNGSDTGTTEPDSMLTGYCKMEKNQAEKPFSILYVEDEHLTRHLVATRLSRRYPDIHIDTADNGATGLDLFMKFHHNLIITDNRMPHMSGLRMVSAIRAISPCVPVIILTASIPENSLQDIPPMECTFLLLKPFQPHELFSLIDRYTKLH